MLSGYLSPAINRSDLFKCKSLKAKADMMLLWQRQPSCLRRVYGELTRTSMHSGDVCRTSGWCRGRALTCAYLEFLLCSLLRSLKTNPARGFEIRSAQVGHGVLQPGRVQANESAGRLRQRCPDPWARRPRCTQSLIRLLSRLGAIGTNVPSRSILPRILPSSPDANSACRLGLHLATAAA